MFSLWCFTARHMGNDDAEAFTNFCRGNQFVVKADKCLNVSCEDQ